LVRQRIAGFRGGDVEQHALIVIRVVRWLFGRYIWRGTKLARLDCRLLSDWCDYMPAHRRVKWAAVVDGCLFGQSCTRHAGALLIDAQKRSETAAIEPAGLEPSRMMPVIR
jgi:hypothetical protein